MNYIIIPGIRKNALTKRAAGIPGKPLTAEDIVKKVCEHFNIDKEGLLSKSRERRFSYPRHIAMWLMYKTTAMSLKDIGGFFRRHHTSVLHSRETINDLMYSDEHVKDEVNLLLKQ